MKLPADGCDKAMGAQNGGHVATYESLVSPPSSPASLSLSPSMPQGADSHNEPPLLAAWDSYVEMSPTGRTPDMGHDLFKSLQRSSPVAQLVSETSRPYDPSSGHTMRGSTTQDFLSTLDKSGNWAPEGPYDIPSSQIASRQMPVSHTPPHLQLDWTSSPGSAIWRKSPPDSSQNLRTPPSADRTSTLHTPAPLNLLPPDVAIMTLKDHPELRALLSLLPSKQGMRTLASDLKSAWQQDLQVVQTDVTD